MQPSLRPATRTTGRSTSVRSGLWKWGFMLSLLVGCLGAEAPVPESVKPPVVVEQTVEAQVDPTSTTELLPNQGMPLPGVVTGGQPTSVHLRALAESGFTTVINLRLEEEEDFSTQIEETETLGLDYVHIPIGGAEDLTPDSARALADAMHSAGGPVAIHCRSGNRVGALLAVKAAWIDGASPEEALELGLAGGLTRLEPAVRGLLESDAN